MVARNPGDRNLRPVTILFGFMDNDFDLQQASLAVRSIDIVASPRRLRDLHPLAAFERIEDDDLVHSVGELRPEVLESFLRFLTYQSV